MYSNNQSDDADCMTSLGFSALHKNHNGFFIACDVLGYAALMVGPNGQIVAASSRAVEMLEDCSTPMEGCTMRVSPAGMTALRNAVASLASNPDAAESRVVLLPRPGRRPIIGYVITWSLGAVGEESACAVILVNPEDAREPANFDKGGLFSDEFRACTRRFSVSRTEPQGNL